MTTLRLERPRRTATRAGRRSLLEPSCAEAAADRLADHIRSVVEAAPPLTRDQVDRITSILQTGGASE